VEKTKVNALQQIIPKQLNNENTQKVDLPTKTKIVKILLLN
jgi:hypothetical protein